MVGPLELSQLAATVAQMRALGVTKFGDIELGPDPNVQTDGREETQRTADAQASNRERKRLLKFGASGGPRVRAALK